MTYCQNCGHNIGAEKPIDRDGFHIDPNGPITYNGRELKLTKVQRCMLSTLAHSYRRRVSAQMLADRCCYVEGRLSVVRTHLSILRRKLEKQGVPVPFRNDWDVGYYWEV